MNLFALLLFVGCAGALLTVRRERAMIPLLLGCTFMTMGQGIELGGVSLPVYRMLMLVGIVRIVIKGERIDTLNMIDKLMIAWAAWVGFAGIFHDQERAGVIYSLGSAFNLFVAYFLARAWCANLEELVAVIKVIAFLLVPIACEMIIEKFTGRNFFSMFGGVPEFSMIREGKLRAQGPFMHPILAGTVGATSIALFVSIFERHRLCALMGIAAGLVITIACASSGPVMSLLAAAFALGMWRLRQHTPLFLYGAAGLYILLLFTMEQPPYYLISRIDISGGSTGWHRSFLIEQTFAHFPEWWLFGTDATRHWMPGQGIAADPYHTDITNYYIGFGVLAGFPAMMLVLSMMGVAFFWVGKTRMFFESREPGHAFTIWCYGSCLFAHAVTGISVSYFDQSAMYLWLSVAVISSAYSAALATDDSMVAAPGDETVDAQPDLEATALANAQWRRKIRERAPSSPLGSLGPPLDPG